MISLKAAAAVIERFENQALLVVGDLMLDRYVSGVVNRISPEAPVPVVHVVGEYARPGGAANVALNIQALGGRAAVAGVVGADAAGEELIGILREAGIATEGVAVAEGYQTCVKTRIIAERQQVVRVDREDGAEAIGAAACAAASRVAGLVQDVRGVVIEDYGKGALAQPLVDAVLEAAQGGGVPVGFDPNPNHDLEVSGVAIATPNYREACLAAGLREVPLVGDLRRHATLRKAAEVLSARWGAGMLVITLGPHGMYLKGAGGEPVVIPARAREVFDVSGAGDTVIATAMLARAAGAAGEEAVMLSNVASGVVVGKLGTATCSAQELRAALE